MGRRVLEQFVSGSTSERGLWMPSLPRAITLLLLVMIGLTAVYVSPGVRNPMGVHPEMTTVVEKSLVAEDGSVVVIVVDAESDEPIDGATVMPVSESVPIDATSRTSGESGEVRFEFGDEDGIRIDWSTGKRFASVTFEIEPPGEKYVDRQSNSELAIQRTANEDSETVDTTGTDAGRHDSPEWGRSNSKGLQSLRLDRTKGERERFGTISIYRVIKL